MFAAAFYFIEGVAIVETDSGYVLIDRTGTVLARGFEYLDGIVAEGRVPVSRNGKHGYLDLRGNIAIPLIYDEINSFGPRKEGRKVGLH